MEATKPSLIEQSKPLINEYLTNYVEIVKESM